MNGKLLQEFSRRTTERLRAALPLRIALPHLEPFLALNVAKEVRKDALVIRCAAEALAAGSPPPGPEARQELLEATKAIDRTFLDGAGAFPLGIVIHYGEIAPLRLRRIARLLEASYRILDAWRARRGARAALRAAYPRPELERLVNDMLRLYALETRALSRAVRLPALLLPLRERLALSLFEIMDQTAAHLASEVARAVHDCPRHRWGQRPA